MSEIVSANYFDTDAFPGARNRGRPWRQRWKKVKHSARVLVEAGKDVTISCVLKTKNELVSSQDVVCRGGHPSVQSPYDEPWRASLEVQRKSQVRKKKQATVIEMYLVKHHPSLRGSRERSALCVCWMEWQGSYTSFVSTKYVPFPSIFTQNALGYTVGRELPKNWIMGSLGPLQMHMSHQGLNTNGKRVFVTYEFEW
eukprot:g81600.t1